MSMLSRSSLAELKRMEEFVFRFNRRHSNNRRLVFWRVVCAVVNTQPFPRAELAQRPSELGATDRQHAQ